MKLKPLTQNISRRVIVRVLFTVVLWSLPVSTVQTSGLTVAENGKSAFSIVGDAADPAVRDLRVYLGKITGADLPVVRLDIDPLPDRAIIVGDRPVPGYVSPALSPQGFHLKVLGSHVVIRGGSNIGTQFGVYGLLDDHFGCRWLSPEFESIPSQPILELPDSLDEIQEPSVRDREGHGLTYAFARSDQVGKDWKRRNRVGSMKRGGAYHNMYALMPPSKYFNDHPDWYPLTQAGVRLNNDPMQCMTWSNPGMIAELTRVVLDIMSRTPEDTLVTVAQGDGYTPSYDPGDRALVGRYGAESAALIFCLNEVLKETKKKFPNHSIVTFAYQGSHIAPINKVTGERLLPDPNLYIEWVRQGDSMHNINSAANVIHRDEFLEWTTVTPHLRVWSWSVGFQALLSPFPNYKAMAEDIQWFAPQVKGFSHQSSSLKTGDWQEMRDWLWARLLWNKTHNIESLEQDFLKHYFGSAAAEPLWRYLSAVQLRAQQSASAFNAVGGSDPASVKRELFPTNALDRALAEFEQALTAARASGNPDFERHVRETRANSLAYLLYVPPQSLRRVEVKGQTWLLPNGDPQFAETGSDIAEELRFRVLYEYSNPWFNRQNFVARAGGPNAPNIETASLRVEFNSNLRGIIASVYDKRFGRDLVSIGPSDNPSEGGMRDTIQDGVHDVRFQEIRDNEATKVTSDAAVITNPYLQTYPLVQRRVVTVPNARSEIDVTTSLFTTSDLVTLAQWYPDPVYRFSTSEAIYQGRLLIRFNVWNPALLRVTFVASVSVATHDFSKSAEFQIPAITQSDPQPIGLCYISNGPEDPVVVVEIPLSYWEQLRFTYEPNNQHLVLTGSTPRKAAIIGRDVSMTRYKLRVITHAEAEGETPVINLRATPGETSIQLAWQAKSFPDLAGYKVYQGTDLAGPFVSVQAQLVPSNEFRVSNVESGRRYFFHVTAVDQQGREGLKSRVVSGVPEAGSSTTFLVANNGAGEFLTIQEAFDALPRNSWQSDYTIEVLDTSAQFPLGYGGGKLSREVIDASKGKRLNLRSRGGRAVIHDGIDFSVVENVPGNVYTYRTTTTVEGFRFVSTADVRTSGFDTTALSGPGTNSIVRNNWFRNWSHPLKLSDYADNVNTLIERNLFEDFLWTAISDNGASTGGVTGAPLIIRNNVFRTGQRALWLAGPSHTFLVNNTFVDISKESLRMFPEATFTVANNLFVSMPYVAYAIVWSPAEELVASACRWDYNLFWASIVARTKSGEQDVVHSTLTDFQTRFQKDLHSLQADPLFLAVDANRDIDLERFQVEPNSPAVDAGTISDIPYGEIDFFGNPRVTAGKIDIGAFEHPLPQGYRLVVFSVHGAVHRSPASPAYAAGTPVVLAPVPEQGYRFAGWSGDVAPGRELDNPLTVVVDGRKNLTARFQLAVLDIADRSVTEGRQLAFTATPLLLDESNKKFRFRLGLGAPSGAEINQVTGEFTWTPSEIQGPGVYPLSVRAEDNSAPPQTETSSFRVTVIEANQPPVLGLNTTVTNRTFVDAADIASPQNAGIPSTMRTNSDGTFDVSVSGSIIGGIEDQFHFAYQEVVGDFDVQVQVVSLRAVDDVAYAVLMMRETLEPNSRFVHLGVLPANETFPKWRSRTGGVVEGSLSYSAPLNYPNVWLKMQRRGNQIRMFRGNDGKTWNPLNWDLSGVGIYPKRLFVGVGTCGRKNAYNDPRLLTEARYANLEIVHQGPGSIPGQFVNESVSLALKLSAFDRDLPQQNLRFSLDAGAAEGATIDPVTGLFSWTPSENHGGNSYSMTMRVIDDGDTPSSTTQAFNVTVNEANSAPKIAPLSGLTTLEHEPFRFTPVVADDDIPPNKFTWSLAATAPLGMAIDPITGGMVWTPNEWHGGERYTVIVTVTDDGKPPLSDSKSFGITVQEVNSPPILTPMADLTIDELRELTFNMMATDPDLPANRLTFSLDPSAPVGVTISSDDGVFRWTPTEEQGPGTYAVTVRVSDNGSPPLADTKTFAVTVNEVNSAPAFAAVPDQSIARGREFTLTASATDPDVPPNTLTYSLAPGAPEGMTIESSSGLIKWTPSASQNLGAYPVTIVVTDNGTPPLSAERLLNLTVVNANSAPTISITAPTDGARFNAPATIKIETAATDADGTVTNVALFSGTRLLREVLSEPFSFIWSDVPAGTYTLFAQAADNQGAIATSAPVNITVSAAWRSIELTTGGEILFSLIGEPDRDYGLETATDLTQWSLSQTKRAGATGKVTFLEPVQAQVSHRFYRARKQP